MTPLVDAKGLAISGRLEPTELSLSAGELVALIGPNGGGKTSLLRSLAGVEGSHGDVVIGGERVAFTPPVRRARLLSFLPASRDLVWPISARDVIRLGLEEPDEERIDRLIEMLELENLAERPINGLSTGERARVLLARALAPRPRLLLLDEPLSNLDPYWVLRTLELVRDEVERNGSAAILSVHDLDRIEGFDRALLVSEGRIIADRQPCAMLASTELSQAFRIRRNGPGWQVRRPEDPRSSL